MVSCASKHLVQNLRTTSDKSSSVTPDRDSHLRCDLSDGEATWLDACLVSTRLITD